jgi:hypothetical protein
MEEGRRQPRRRAGGEQQAPGRARIKTPVAPRAGMRGRWLRDLCPIPVAFVGLSPPGGMPVLLPDRQRGW